MKYFNQNYFQTLRVAKLPRVLLCLQKKSLISRHQKVINCANVLKLCFYKDDIYQRQIGVAKLGRPKTARYFHLSRVFVLNEIFLDFFSSFRSRHHRLRQTGNEWNTIWFWDSETLTVNNEFFTKQKHPTSCCEWRKEKIFRRANNDDEISRTYYLMPHIKHTRQLQRWNSTRFLSFLLLWKPWEEKKRLRRQHRLHIDSTTVEEVAEKCWKSLSFDEWRCRAKGWDFLLETTAGIWPKPTIVISSLCQSFGLIQFFSSAADISRSLNFSSSNYIIFDVESVSVYENVFASIIFIFTWIWWFNFAQRHDSRLSCLLISIIAPWWSEWR